jgi:sarcosine oxidase subunit beta
MQETPDALIIGAGALGCAIALELSSRGLRTLNVDRLRGPGEGSTSDSASIVRLYASTPDMVAMAVDAVAIWTNWSDYIDARDEGGHARYIRTGSLLVKSPAGGHEQAARALDSLGVPFEDWSAAELQERLPLFDVRSFWPPRPIDDESFFEDEPARDLDGALHVPEGGYVNDPRLATHNLAVAAARRGAAFEYRASVVEIVRERDRVAGVRLDGGRLLRAPIVVNVAGPHGAIINRMARVEGGMSVRTRPLRHELHVIPSPPGFDYETAGLQVSDGDLGINFRPESGNQILVGSEDPPCDPLAWVDDPDSLERAPTPSQWERQVYRLARRIPSLRIPMAPKGLAGLYDVSSDSQPIYDRSDLPGFYMAIGTNGNQFKMAPVVGRLMSELILACEAGHDHDASPLSVPAQTSPERFDMGAFSRLRPAPAEPRISVV